MTVLIDKMEKTPWSFSENVKTESAYLVNGDYCLKGDGAYCIERKSLDDFINTVVCDWDRFQRELYRTFVYGQPQLVIMVECDFAQCVFQELKNRDMYDSEKKLVAAYCKEKRVDECTDVASFVSWADSTYKIVLPEYVTNVDPVLVCGRIADLSVFYRASVLFAGCADQAAAMAEHILAKRNQQINGTVKYLKDLGGKK